MSNRPTGVKVIAVWYIAQSLFLGLLFLIVWLQPEGFSELGKGFAEFHLSGRWFLFSTSLITALTFLSGVGLWAGEKGGWWLGTFCSIYGVAGALQTMRLQNWFHSVQHVGDSGPDRTLPLAGRAALSFGVVLYLMRAEIMDHFGIPESRRVTSIGVSVIVVLLMLGVASAIGRT